MSNKSVNITTPFIFYFIRLDLLSALKNKLAKHGFGEVMAKVILPGSFATKEV